MRDRGRTLIALWVIACAGAVLVGCGSSGGDRVALAARGACEAAHRQQAQADSLVHVLPGAPQPTYVSDPPTSGPHTAVPRGTTVYRTPLARPAQVGVLERGDVLVQYRPADADAAAVASLEALAPAGGRTVVAPNPDLPGPVVASAWLYLRTCRAVDVDALRPFIADRSGKGPDGH